MFSWLFLLYLRYVVYLHSVLFCSHCFLRVGICLFDLVPQIIIIPNYEWLGEGCHWRIYLKRIPPTSPPFFDKAKKQSGNPSDYRSRIWL